MKTLINKILWKTTLLCIATSMSIPDIYAQTRLLTLNQTVEMALSNSNALKLKRTSVDLAIINITRQKDQSLPTGSVSGTFSHTEI